MLAQAALAYARFVDEEKRAEEVDGVLDLKPKRERKQSGKITRWTEAEEAPPCLTLSLALALTLTLTGAARPWRDGKHVLLRGLERAPLARLRLDGEAVR